MARRGRRRSFRPRKIFGSLSTQLFRGLKVVAAPVAFFEQISEKDRSDLGSSYSEASTFDQIKMILNITGGRVAGIRFFKTIDGKTFNNPPQTLSSANLVNKWTMGGGAAILYGVLGKAINKTSSNAGFGSVLPATSKIMSLGKSIFAGGFLGGAFDDPLNSSQGSSGSFPVLNRTPQLQISRGFSGSDPTGSGFQ